MNQLPAFIIQRLRTPVPAGYAVVPGSTPVVAFGNPLLATIATLGLNPSRNEFLDLNGQELLGNMRRFETLKSLGAQRLQDSKESILQQVFDGCCAYFTRRPYRQRFDPLGDVAHAAYGSYDDGSACHLDLAQWATDPVWAKLESDTVRQRLRKSLARSRPVVRLWSQAGHHTLSTPSRQISQA